MPRVKHEGALVSKITDSEFFNIDNKEPDEDELASIFRAYDIRGIVNQTLTSEVVRKIGQAIGSEAKN